MKLSYIKLPNEILDMNLTANELAVLIYLSSIYSKKGDTLQVKQSTIAKKCGIKTTQTVSKITAKLADMGLIIRRRCIFDNNSTGMIYYALNLPKAAKGYFFVQRQIVNEQLSPVLLRVCLYICRSLSPMLGKCWNSYNDLAKLIGISRSKAIELVAQLVKKNVIRKQKVKTLRNKRVYGDNHYTVVCYGHHKPIKRRFQGKKIGLPPCKSGLMGQSVNLSYVNTFYGFNNSTKINRCQVRWLKFFQQGVVPKIKGLYNNQILLI